ncbi:3-polyprenyl-4-hydroxybenzoate decarboxylase-like protein [Frankia casuarinae]|uniref:3-polyprenyl-4-hydroxybenzoate decarboxylase and related decarboxylases-like n=1 Tax=Frankia casuarinae (strain DSM 45818 / CECT 9043 / HFP020203 / CcI3) TaxID=106370 RepID=Q2JC66_FRACC|nr:UbiD family decarboxylase [Frankia casuarinae]ABD11126.1 3-polyprenyl-4-hydroxybenzoate decarboxylase and related decarboxylases-like [Frankia casuarinae]EYT90897.1 3-polyprenyl-4-hydroxybenzoate decarboxylase-like protein [Frankia casuarinae]
MTSTLDHLAPIDLPQFGLGPHYAATKVRMCAEPLSTDVEVMRRLAEFERLLGRRPTTLFTQLTDRPGTVLLGHPYPRAVLLAALGTDEGHWLDEVAARLAGPAPAPAAGARPALTELPGLSALPIIRHRPGDVGRYVTAGVGVTTRPDRDGVNLGIYRIQVVGEHEARIFLDPRTDGHANLGAWTDVGEPMPISVFLGADPVHMMVAASRLPARDGAALDNVEDDYRVAGMLLGRAVRTHGSPPVPESATHVLHATVRPELAREGPFGEFKGYYAEERMSNVLDVWEVLAAPGAPMPTILAGGESGLTLMSMQNEYLMYAHLTEIGVPVRTVHYPLPARGEFLALVETDEPTREVLAEAMRFDVRSKVVVCGPDLKSIWQALATHGFSSRVEPYLRKGRVEGERLGLLLDIPPTGRPVEY